MSKLPYMKLWVADYLSDTLHLNMEQNGAYLQLLMVMWKQGGALRSEPEYLAKVCRMTLQQWERIAPQVMAYFTVVELSDGDLLQHPRLSEELAKARRVSEVRSDVAKRKSLKNLNGRGAEAQQKLHSYSDSHSYRGRGLQKEEADE